MPGLAPRYPTRQLFDLIIPEATYIYTVHANYVSAARANVRNWKQLPSTLVRYTNVWIGP